MAQSKNTVSNQLHKALRLLQDMRDNVTASDRAAAMDAFTVSKSTISAYLNGDGLNLDLAMELIQFFNSRIEEREEILKDLAAA